MTLRQTVTVAVTVDVPAVEDWDAVKWPGWMSRDPETGEWDVEPPVTFREELADEVRHAVLVGVNGDDWNLTVLGARVTDVEDVPDPVPYDPATEEPF